MTDKQLLSHMESMKITYGFYDDIYKKIITDKDKEFNTPGYIDKHCRILFPKEVEKYKVGTCWDTSLYMYSKLKTDCKKYVNNVKMVYVDTIKPSFLTHTTVMYQHRTSKLWYWMEYSWEKYRGIHGGMMQYKNLFKKFEYMWTKDTPIHFKNTNVDADTLLSMKKITVPIFFSICTIQK